MWRTCYLCLFLSYSISIDFFHSFFCFFPLIQYVSSGQLISASSAAEPINNGNRAGSVPIGTKLLFELISLYFERLCVLIYLFNIFLNNKNFPNHFDYRYVELGILTLSIIQKFILEKEPGQFIKSSASATKSLNHRS